ncbi:MAG: M48 family metallopeptidase, partial [Dehalococcoidia bacterium]|nr:M48 family metallopeptidase [Dehalococcoidia bacterium]
TRFGILKGTLQLAVLLAFWFAGGFDALDRVVRAWSFGPVIAGVAYLGIIAAGYMVFTLPFGIYGTFVVEQRYGFNRTTPAVFIADRAKGLALSVVLGVPLLAGVLAIFSYGGMFAWIYCWAAVTAVSLGIQFVAPTWIMPWFNKFKPMEPGELKDAILRYADTVDYHLDNVYVMDGSKRSTRSNAFFTGFGRNKRIVLFDTLIADHTVPELVAVLAHEIGHYKKRHVAIGTVFGIAHTGILFFLFSLFLSAGGLYQAFGVQQSVYAGLMFFGLLYTPIELALSVAMQAFYRHNEYQADRFAVTTIDDAGRLEDALKKLSVKNLSILSAHTLYDFLNYSHPPLLQRIEAIRKTKRGDQ